MIRIEAGTDSVAYFEVNPISFAAYAQISVDLVPTDKAERQKLFQRKRLVMQSKAFDANGAPVAVDDALILSLPPRVGQRLISAGNMVIGATQEPAILQEGDGVTTPILVRLAEPITYTDKDGKKVISELEFMAKTFGDIESTVAESNPLRQVLVLIESCAKPVTDNMRMQQLPKWALEKISIIDGGYIGQEVVPLFLE